MASPPVMCECCGMEEATAERAVREGVFVYFAKLCGACAKAYDEIIAPEVEEVRT